MYNSRLRFYSGSAPLLLTSCYPALRRLLQSRYSDHHRTAPPLIRTAGRISC